MTAHESPGSTKLHEGTHHRITPDEVGRIVIRDQAYRKLRQGTAIGGGTMRRKRNSVATEGGDHDARLRTYRINHRGADRGRCGAFPKKAEAGIPPLADSEGEGAGDVAEGGSGPDGTGPGGYEPIPRAGIETGRTAHRGRGVLQEGPPLAGQHIADHPREDADRRESAEGPILLAGACIPPSQGKAQEELKEGEVMWRPITNIRGSRPPSLVVRRCRWGEQGGTHARCLEVRLGVREPSRD